MGEGREALPCLSLQPAEGCEPPQRLSFPLPWARAVADVLGTLVYLFVTQLGGSLSSEGSECVCPEGAERGTSSLQSSAGRQRVVLSDPCDSWAFPYIRGGSWVAVNSFSFIHAPVLLVLVQGVCACADQALQLWGELGGVCGCCSPCSAPRPFSFCVSPVNQTLQALGSTVTQEQGFLEQSSAVLPLSPAPLCLSGVHQSPNPL